MDTPASVLAEYSDSLINHNQRIKYYNCNIYIVIIMIIIVINIIIIIIVISVLLVMTMRIEGGRNSIVIVNFINCDYYIDSMN